MKNQSSQTAKTPLSRKTDKTCFHCGQLRPRFCDLTVNIDSQELFVCCHGCKAAAEFINTNGMVDFYDYRGDSLPDQPALANNDSKAADAQWLKFNKAGIVDSYLKKVDGRVQVSIYIQGIYCSSCGWLIEKSLQRSFGGLRISLNIDTHYLQLSWTDDEIKLSQVLNLIAKLGYLPRPIEWGHGQNRQVLLRDQENKASLKRLIVAGLGTMQVMTYAVGLYWGDYQGMDADVRQFLNLISMLVATAVVFYAGRPFFIHALYDLKNRHLGMDVPVALAIGSAYFLSVYEVLFRSGERIYFDSAVMFVFLLSLGRHVEMRARYHNAAGVDEMRQLLPPLITVYRAGQAMTLQPEQIEKGDDIELSTGDTVPCDGLILSGQASLDQSFINGEATPTVLTEGEAICAGSVLRDGAITLKSDVSWQNSSIAAIQCLLDTTSNQKPKNQISIDILTRYFVAFILLLTALVGCFWWFYQPQRVFEIVLAMLIASCPCAFSLATPVVATVASHFLRRNGILLANFDVLDKVRYVSHWCFDKTGTLTQGQVDLVKVDAFTEIDESQCLQIAATLEQDSDHVLATTLTRIDTDIKADNIQTVPGRGVSGDIAGQRYYLGNQVWVYQQAQIKADYEQQDQVYTQVLLAKQGQLLSCLYLSDAARDDASKTLDWLRQTDKKVVILSGDRQSVVDQMAASLHINEAKGDMLPEDKLDYLRTIQNGGAVTAMVGDGINDAPVLKQADISIAMVSGSQLSQSQADVVLAGGRLQSLQTLYTVAAKARNIVLQNMAWALAYNLIIIPLAAFGYLTPWVAALGMSVSSLIVVLNARRLNYTKPV